MKNKKKVFNYAHKINYIIKGHDGKIANFLSLKFYDHFAFPLLHFYEIK